MMDKTKKNAVSRRGFMVQGVVVSDKRKRTVTVQRDLVTYVPKYKRYARKISKISAHNPDEMGARTGDVVEIAECRKISKTKAWIVTKILAKGAGHLLPGQVKAHDEAQRSHEGKEKYHSGKAQEKEGKEKNPLAKGKPHAQKEIVREEEELVRDGEETANE